MSQAVKEPVGEKSATILQKMQRSVISSTLNIARSFKFLLKQRGLLLSDLFLGQNFIIESLLYIEIFIETFSICHRSADLKLS